MSEIDLSFLEALISSKSNIPSNEEKEPTESNSEGNKAIPEPPKLISQKWSNSNDYGTISIERRQLREATERASLMYQDYSEKISKSSDYRKALCKGVKAGTPTPELLLIACKCISDLTGDKAFLYTIEEALK